jgi:hypothetical protein
MDGFWHFAGSFWWLVFPLGGAVVTVIGRVWRELNQAARERHERRLERLAVRQGIGVAGRQGAPDAAPTTSSTAARAVLERIMSDHDQVNARWLDYELDVTKLIDYPLMTDVREPLMVSYLKAKRLADSLRPADEDLDNVPAETVERYRLAVTDYRVAFDIAEAEAHRVKDRDFSPAERERLERARQLITLSVDRAATPAERQQAYSRARRELDGLLSLSAETVRSMEDGALRAIEPKRRREGTSELP